MSSQAPSGPGLLRAPVAITGMGAVTSFGDGTATLWRALAEGADGIAPITRFSTAGFSVQNAAMVPDGGAASARKTEDLALDFAIRAALEAVRSAALEPASAAPSRVAIVFGTSLATHPDGIHRLAEITGDEVGARGPRLTISTACSSSANAIGLGRDLLLDGSADAVIAGGADALTGEIFAGFHNLGLLAPERCAPFSEPSGTTLGEGAGFVVLERAEDAARRGAGVLGHVSGYGLSCDAHHATSPDPTGAGVTRAARAALADAGLSPADIDYVNAHGTGTEANDPAEWRGILGALGDAAKGLPVSATKSVFGHGQGAAGVLELIATLLAMQHGMIPQTLHHTRPRPRCPSDPVAQRTPRPHRVAHALCNSSAFGGANAIVAIDAADRAAAPRKVTRRAVRLIGAGLVLPGIADAGELARLAATDARFGRIAPGPAPRSLAGVDLRGFDPLSRHLTFAAAEALRQAGLPPRGSARDRMGLFAALRRISPASAHELNDSVKERGLLRLSAPAFTRVVLNASTGACARALQLRGPTTTLTTGDGCGLTALVLAAEALSLRDDADLLCAAAADEIDRLESPESLCEAGACIVLAAGDAAPASSVAASGWGLAGPGEVALAIARALAMAGIDPAKAPAVESGGPRLVAPSAHPLLRAALAFHGLRAGERTSVLLAHGGSSCSCAVIFERIHHDP